MAWSLLEEALDPRRPVRLVGVGLSQLMGPDAQLQLPLGPPRRPSVSSALDAVRERFGYEAIQTGRARLRTRMDGGEEEIEARPAQAAPRGGRRSGDRGA